MGIIIKPLVTEKMTAITDKTNNRFGFIVRPEANKLEIKKEVEALYNVTVVDVNTMRQLLIANCFNFATINTNCRLPILFLSELSIANYQLSKLCVQLKSKV